MAHGAGARVLPDTQNQDDGDSRIRMTGVLLSVVILPRCSRVSRASASLPARRGWNWCVKSCPGALGRASFLNSLEERVVTSAIAVEGLIDWSRVGVLSLFTIEVR